MIRTLNFILESDADSLEVVLPSDGINQITVGVKPDATVLHVTSDELALICKSILSNLNVR